MLWTEEMGLAVCSWPRYLGGKVWSLNLDNKRVLRWRKRDQLYDCGLPRYLDGKVWPEKDEFAVRLLLSLIHHVTGVRLKAFFATAPETANGDHAGHLRCGIIASRDICC